MKISEYDGKEGSAASSYGQLAKGSGSVGDDRVLRSGIRGSDVYTAGQHNAS